MAENENPSDMSDSETMCSVSDMSDISETMTAVDVQLPDPPINALYYLDAPTGPYLTQKRYNDFREFKLRHPRQPSLIPPPLSIEFAFEDFVSAAARAYLTAQATPPSRTSPGTCTEFQEVARRLGVPLDTSVPSTNAGLMENHLEVKRMMLTSVLRFAEVWKNCLPNGVNKRLLFKDILTFIHKKAEARKTADHIKTRLGEAVFRYQAAEWKDVLEEDLEASRWIRWKDGASV
ncbi:hypothetical protein PQX77_005749 [Marasmius sp. AFHP31]|nr:hypothetical protein PQX77_005749 [Marasmius sp. AFHP31]